ncbi:FAD binding domain-containing protein [Paenalcaligenes niemegkensis]|uniref:FAD binding domain-containing protein n=1 Tax=Paenalcaligenes niemegkensis TaxID=2895469 RepID=UPI001EE98476|nr:FAD binding domain-containing protein [Paenalcaligenes niemegkensis]MCQ9617708.1 FAD binding domain-containing protein [Paenalcaligenes niemegkensis]
MKPRRFEFHNPDHLDEIWELAEKYEDDFMFYAGGTEAIIGLKERVIDVGHVINVKNIPELSAIRVEDGVLRIGALVTHQEIADSELVQSVLPSYAALSNNVANIRVRNAGTLAGNLCFAEPNADPPAMLAALNAYVELCSSDGKRQVHIREFFDGPYTTVREDHEFLSEIAIPVSDKNQFSVYRKIVYLNRPSAGVAVVRNTAQPHGNWEVWAGSLTGVPERMNQLCAYLNDGQALSEAGLLEVAQQDTVEWDVLDGVYGSVDYRKHLATVLAARGVMESIG